MCQRFISVAVVALILNGATAYSDCGCSSSPAYAPIASSYVSYYAPPVAEAPAPYASYYAPPVAAAPAPYVSYYAPPVAYAAPAPCVSYYAPAVPYATYYAAPAPAMVPYRAYYGVAGWSVYGTPRVYVPGEPVRNALRAVTP